MTYLATTLTTRGYYSNYLNKMVLYTVIPMDKLDLAREMLHESLKKNNIKYKLRTFYSGPRRRNNATTNKSDARFAKIGVYTVDSYGYCNLTTYF